MARNSKSSKSLLELQNTLRDLASWRLAAARNAKAALETSQNDLLEALGRTDGVSGALIPLVSKRLRDVNRDIATAGIELETQSRQAIACGARSKMAKKIHQRIEQEEKSKAERNALMELIECRISAGKSRSA
jgi:hypothetical protein